MGITKEQRKLILNKAVDLAYDGIGLEASQKRLFDFCRGLLSDSEVSFDEVYIAVKRSILTVQAVLEEVKEDVHVESTGDDGGCLDSVRLP